MIQPFMYDIVYLLAVPDWRPEDATPLAGFSHELSRSSFLIRKVSLLPSNILASRPSRRESTSAARISGLMPIHWYPRSPRAIRSLVLGDQHLFTVVLLGPGQKVAEYQEWVGTCRVPPTLVAERDGDLGYDGLTLSALQARFLHICDHSLMHLDAEDVACIRETIAGWNAPSNVKLPYTVGGHATTTPNAMALVGLGYNSPIDQRFDQIGKGLAPYVGQIVLTTRSIFDARAQLGPTYLEDDFPRRPALNLFAPAMYPSALSLKARDAATREEKRRMRDVINILATQHGYGFELDSERKVEALFGMTSAEIKKTGSPDPHPLIRIRQLELALATEAIGSLAYAESTAVVRLPNEINRTAGAVRQFAAHYRGNSRSTHRRREMFRSVQGRIGAAVPHDIRALIADAEGEIRVIADAHLEWLDCDGLPLCIRHHTSRMPVTPGNLFVEQMTHKPIIRLKPVDLRRILVVSALNRHDPIRGIFERAFAAYAEVWKNQLEISFVEVGSVKEFVTALNVFDGPIVIFDGHGSHSEQGPALLHLKDAPVDVWELVGKVRPPPIVILSACDTHAADRNHATTANGFLAMGTRAVLASVFPLDARSAALFTARLLYRIAAFIPTAVGVFNSALSWTEVISGMLRMQLLSDFRHALEQRRSITEEQSKRLGVEGNIAINNRRRDPFNQITEMVAALGLDRAIVRQELETAIAGSSAISYLNMGRPETILVDTEKRMEQSKLLQGLHHDEIVEASSDPVELSYDGTSRQLAGAKRHSDPPPHASAVSAVAIGRNNDSGRPVERMKPRCS